MRIILKTFVLLFIPAMFILNCLLSACSVQADEPQVIKDDWYVLTYDGKETGWNNEKTVGFEKDGEKCYKTYIEIRDTSYVDGGRVISELSDWVLEDHRGSIIEMHSETKAGGRTSTQHLKVKGDIAELVRSKDGVEEKSIIYWEELVLGPMGIHLFMLEKCLEPGAIQVVRSYRLYKDGVFDLSIESIGWEEVELLEGGKEKLFHLGIKGFMPDGIVTEIFVDSKCIVKKFTAVTGGTIAGGYGTTEKRAKEVIED